MTTQQKFKSEKLAALDAQIAKLASARKILADTLSDEIWRKAPDAEKAAFVFASKDKRTQEEVAICRNRESEMATYYGPNLGM